MDAQIKPIDELLIDDIIEREGDQFTDDPADRGGATKYGITQRSWDKYTQQHISKLPHVAYVRDLDELRAREFYRVMYVQPLAWIDDLALRELVLDSAVNCGAERVVKWLQRASGCIAVDGIIGPETRARVNNYGNPTALYPLILIARFKHYAKLVKTDPTQLRFIEGWVNRACEFIR